MTTTTSSSGSQPPQPSAEPQLIPKLPDDVSIDCLARVPSSHYRDLSLVSKTWHSAITSSTLLTARSRLRTTQTFLYLNLRIDNSVDWYTLVPNCQNPQKLIFPLPRNRVQPVGPALAVLGPKIYVIGGAFDGIPSNSMWVYDCRFNRWEEGPRMKVGREFAGAGVVDGKIYVLGGCVVDGTAQSMDWAEVFDPVTGLWTTVPSPVEVRLKRMHASVVMEGRVYAMAGRSGEVYDVGVVGKCGNVLIICRRQPAVVQGVLYCCNIFGKIAGYDVEEGVWKELKGVGKGLPTFVYGTTMVNFDGRLCVVWEKKGSGKEVEIKCADIEVWKDGDGMLAGRILWSGVILKVPNGAEIVHCMAAEF
ncbi:F-box/kelch-repeat protein SKIP6-like [Coffea arabica]|uniref:F-box/kelch-repeat protein SKIP6-like n=1 Tax=Coffea arabica TaxID=13443 RepID=A0A6P6THG5_COFAR|nr:F-box/kelch-repeat protein SKIP6-like [Coffea arabica]XP_027077561.1 F-box/kelch-repeat protein SKIP6-like [Coffea arabica]